MGPDHCVPEVCLPEKFEQMEQEVESMDLTTWWTQFEDPLLDTLIEDALTCNFDLRIALHRIEEVRAFYKIERSNLYPQIQGNMVAIRFRRSETLTVDPITAAGTPTEVIPADIGVGPLIQEFFQLGFDASWELDFWGKNRRKAQAGYAEFEASQEEALFTQITLISDVAQSYIDIRSLQQQIRAIRAQVERQDEIVALADSRYRAGLTSEVDVVRARAQFNAAKASLPPFEEGLQQTIHGLAILLGCPPEKFGEQFGEIGPIPHAFGRIPENLPSQLLCRRPDIRRAERELAAATARIGIAKAELLPNFSLVGNFGTQTGIAKNLFVWPSRFWTIGPSMTWNLFTGGKLLAQIEVTNERQKQAILQYEKTVTTSLQEVEDRLVAYFKEQDRLESLEERFSANSLRRDLALEQYVAGLTSLDNVLDAERDLFLAQEAMLASQGTLMINLVGLYKALGGGWQCLESL